VSNRPSRPILKHFRLRLILLLGKSLSSRITSMNGLFISSPEACVLRSQTSMLTAWRSLTKPRISNWWQRRKHGWLLSEERLWVREPSGGTWSLRDPISLKKPKRAGGTKPFPESLEKVNICLFQRADAGTRTINIMSKIDKKAVLSLRILEKN